MGFGIRSQSQSNRGSCSGSRSLVAGAGASFLFAVDSCVHPSVKQLRLATDHSFGHVLSGALAACQSSFLAKVLADAFAVASYATAYICSDSQATCPLDNSRRFCPQSIVAFACFSSSAQSKFVLVAVIFFLVGRLTELPTQFARGKEKTPAQKNTASSSSIIHGDSICEATADSV